MVKYNNGKIQIDIADGVNVYQHYSATGKSYFPQVAKMYTELPFIKTYDTKEGYVDFVKRDLVAGLEKSYIYFFDRFDIFNTDDVIHWLETVREYTVLVDCKNIYTLFKFTPFLSL